MRILVLADIHANWPALSSIRESFDACLFIGDLVEYGAEPIPCIDWIRKNAKYAIKGNHDHSVSQRVHASEGRGLRRLASVTREHHLQILSPSHLKYLSRLPVTQTFKLDGIRFHLVHATPRDPMDEYLSDQSEPWRARLAGIEADIVCVGHTHLQFHLDLGEWQLLNPGSVGQPRDGDFRAAYAIIENGRIELKRVKYDIDATLLGLKNAGIPQDAIDLAEVVLRTGGRPSM